MPIYEFDGNLSWGYSPCFYFAPDKYYGTELKLKEFIDKCHQRDIAVIFDMTLNHSTGQSPFVRLYNEGTYGTPTEENFWFNTEARHPYNVFYDMNHESSATKYFVDRGNKFWLEEYHIDGYRFDLSKGFTQTNSGDDVSYWGQYDQSRIDILTRMANKIWSVDDSAYVILEHIADNDEETELASRGMMLWGNMNWNYAQCSMGYEEDSDFSWGYYGTRDWDKPNLVTYMESHDEERLMYKNLTWGNSNEDGSYDITELPVALDRMELANAFFLTIPGPRMMWQFGEFGYDLSINWPSGEDKDRLTSKPSAWELGYHQDSKRLQLYHTIKNLLKLRKTESLFTEPNTNVTMDVGGTIKKIELSGSGNAIIAGNFGVTSQNITIDFFHGGQWFDFFSGDTINTTGSETFTYSPGEFHIYSDKKYFTPEQNPVGVVKQQENRIPGKFNLSQNYPNPFNASTVIKYALPEAAQVQIVIYDLAGRKIKTLVNSHKQAGNHRILWNGTDKLGNSLASGVYFYSLQTSEKRITKKMLLIK